MSTQWYFSTFRIDQLTRVCGHATPKQKRALVRTLTDPVEFSDMPDEELENRRRLALDILGGGINYADYKTWGERCAADEVFKMIFHQMGLAKAVGAKPVSREPMSIVLAEELARVAR